MQRFASFFLFHAQVTLLRLQCLFDAPGRRWRGTRCFSDTCFTASTWSGCCATCGSATRTPGSTRYTRPSGESTVLLVGDKLQEERVFKRVCVQVCRCVRPAPADAQLRAEHPVLHDVWGDGAHLARHGEQPEDGEGSDTSSFKDGHRFLFWILSVRCRWPGFEYRRRSLPPHQLPG